MKTIFWAGDSTVKQNTILSYPQTGIGQGFERYVKRGEVVICNCAENGRSTKQFLDEGRLIPICENIRPGDFLLIQFGHNDEKDNDPERFAAADTTYSKNLETFVNAARDKGAVPVIITPLTRRCFLGNTSVYRHEAWAAAARRTASRLNVALVDLTSMSEALVAEWGERSTQLYMHVPAGVYPAFPNGMVDNTHLTPHGAVVFAGLIAKSLYEMGGVYAELICDEYEEWQQIVQANTTPHVIHSDTPVEMDEDSAVGYQSKR